MGGSDSKQDQQQPGQKPAPKPPSLIEASATIGAKIQDLELKISKADEEARDWIAKQSTNPTAKSRAMQAIKRKKLYEQQRDQLLGTQFNVESLNFQQEQAGVTLTAVEAMQQATSHLKQKTDKIGVDTVEKLKDDMADLQADMQDIQQALAQSSGGLEDDEAEKELEALYAAQSQQEEEDAMKILMGGGASSHAAPAAETYNPAAQSPAAMRA